MFKKIIVAFNESTEASRVLAGAMRRTQPGRSMSDWHLSASFSVSRLWSTPRICRGCTVLCLMRPLRAFFQREQPQDRDNYASVEFTTVGADR